jgi:hypothetical protein
VGDCPADHDSGSAMPPATAVSLPIKHTSVQRYCFRLWNLILSYLSAKRSPLQRSPAWGLALWHRLGILPYTRHTRNTWWDRCRPWKGQTSRTGHRIGIGSYTICTPCRGPSLSRRRIPPGRNLGRPASQCTSCRANNHDRSYRWNRHKGFHASKCCVSALPRRTCERSSWPHPCQVPPGRKRHQGTCPVCPIRLPQSQNSIVCLAT